MSFRAVKGHPYPFTLLPLSLHQLQLSARQLYTPARQLLRQKNAERFGQNSERFSQNAHRFSLCTTDTPPYTAISSWNQRDSNVEPTCARFTHANLNKRITRRKWNVKALFQNTVVSGSKNRPLVCLSPISRYFVPADGVSTLIRSIFSNRSVSIVL